jgi:hypothetical protein
MVLDGKQRRGLASKKEVSWAEGGQVLSRIRRDERSSVDAILKLCQHGRGLRKREGSQGERGGERSLHDADEALIEATPPGGPLRQEPEGAGRYSPGEFLEGPRVVAVDDAEVTAAGRQTTKGKPGLHCRHIRDQLQVNGPRHGAGSQQNVALPSADVKRPEVVHTGDCERRRGRDPRQGKRSFWRRDAAGVEPAAGTAFRKHALHISSRHAREVAANFPKCGSNSLMEEASMLIHDDEPTKR